MGTLIQTSSSIPATVSDSLKIFKSKVGRLSTQFGLRTVTWLNDFPIYFQSLKPTTLIPLTVINITSFIATIILTGQLNHWIEENKKIPDSKTKIKIKFIADVCLATLTSYSANTLIAKLSHLPINPSRKLLITSGTVTFYLFLFWGSRPLSSPNEEKKEEVLNPLIPTVENLTEIDEEEEIQVLENDETLPQNDNLTEINEEEETLQLENQNSPPQNDNLTQMDDKQELLEFENQGNHSTAQTGTYIFENGERKVLCPNGSFHVVSPRFKPHHIHNGNYQLESIINEVGPKLGGQKEGESIKKN